MREYYANLSRHKNSDLINHALKWLKSVAEKLELDLLMKNIAQEIICQVLHSRLVSRFN